MKRLFSVVLCLVLFLTACSVQQADAPGVAVQLFFPNADYRTDCAVSVQETILPGSYSTLAGLLHSYRSAVPDASHTSVFPTEWQLEATDVTGVTATVTFTGSDAVSSLDVSLFYVCLCKTIFANSDILRIRIFSPAHPEGITYSEDDIQLKDLGMYEQQEHIVLYYPDDTGRYLVRDTQTVSVMSASEKPEFIMNRLLSADLLGINSCIPTGTRLLGLHVASGVCTINLSSEFEYNMLPNYCAARLAVYSIVNSLTELDDISSVELYISGVPLRKLYLMTLSTTLTRDESLIISSWNKTATDLTLYLPTADSELLVSIPYLLDTSDPDDAKLQLLNALLTYEGKNGIMNCIPAGTKVLSIQEVNGNCTIDLTGEFISNRVSRQSEMMAVRSLISTMTQLPEIKSVDILIEGLEPNYFDSNLGNLHRSHPSWFAR